MTELNTNITSLQKLLSQQRINRREFIAGLSALGISAAFASTLGLQSALAATPKRGGHFRIVTAHGATTDSLDPEKNIVTGMITTIDYAMHNYLTETGPGGQIIPELAETWEASPDAKSWRFKLRKGVDFHNGKSVAAKDVLASINIHRGEKSKSSINPMLNNIKEIVAEDNHTVVIHLHGGNADLPYLLADVRLAILPAKGNGVDWQSKVGAGGYLLKEFEPGVRASLERNPNYWKSDRAHFDTIEILPVSDATARMTSIMTGKVDVIDRVDFKTADMLKRQKSIVVKETSGGLHYTFPMSTNRPPFNDINVRRAVKHAVDRKAMLKTILRGHGFVGNDQPISPNYRFYDSKLEQRIYDPEKAKFYLKKAGFSKLSLDLHAAEAAYSGAVDASILFQSHAKKAGISINVVREPNDGYWSNVWMKKSWSACYWGGSSTEDICFSQAYAGDSSWNDTFWNNKRFNELLVNSRAELDSDRRHKMYSEMQRILRDDGGVVLPLFANDIFAISKKIAHSKLEERWPCDGRRACERWWFA